MSTLHAQRMRPITHGTSAAELPLFKVGFVALEIVLLAAVLILGAIIRTHAGPLPGDVSIALAVQHAIPPHTMQANAIDLVSTVAWPIPSLITAAIIGVLLLALRRWLDVIALYVVDGLANGTNQLISLVVHRPRPSDHGIYIAQQIKVTYSFPSGHVVQGTVFFLFLLFLTFMVREEHTWLWIPRVALILFALSMGPSRIAEGEHWPSDVLGALLFGLFWLLLGIAAYRWAAMRWPKLRGKAGPLPGAESLAA